MRQPDLITCFDHPAINSFIFFPRPDPGFPSPAGSEDWLIPVAEGTEVAARFHPTDPTLPTLLHFHGNGEIVADYDELAPAFHGSGASLVSLDFRGYGRSTGIPSVRSLIEDAYPILDNVLIRLRERGHTGPLVIMGRSLGSAPAIELAAHRADVVAGLIIESGFARTLDLLEHLGFPTDLLPAPPHEGADNADKMAAVTAPLLLLHAEHDSIIPPWHAQLNYDQAASHSKRLVTIPHADHNTILMWGGHHYWGPIAEFLASLRSEE